MKINFNFEEKNVKLGLENQFTIQEFLEVTPVKILMLKGEKGDTVSAEWGTITGDIEDQTDLKNVLDAKADTTDIPDVSDFITKDVDNLTNYTKTSDLSAVATSGDYDDLDNKPTIPSKTSDLTNDSGYIDNTVDNLTNYTKTSNLSTVATSGSYSDLSNKPTIPTKTSDLTNDSNFAVTNADNKFTTGQTIAGETVVDSIRTKNMFSGFVNGAYNSTTGVFNPLTSGIATPKIEVESGGKYCLSGIQNGNTIRVLFWNNNTFISSTTLTTQTENVITMAGNQFAFQTGASTPYTDIQLEKGDTATAYSPYQNLTGKENYSTEEQVIGTWIDGKPLYRKTLYFASNGGGTSEVSYTLSNYGITNVDTIFITHPSFYSNNLNGYRHPFQYYDGNKYSCGVNATTLNVSLGYAPISNSPFVITLEYTKTTD